MRQAGEAEWLLDVPAGWSVVNHPECLTLTPPADESALQISSASKEAGLITTNELREMAEKRSELTGPAFHAVFGAFRGFGVAYEEANVAWRRYWLANDSLLLFVTFNGASTRLLEDLAEGETALGTLRRRA